MVDPAQPNEDAVKVYPNPAGDGVFTVRVSSLADEQVQVVVTDVTGTRVHELTTTTNKETNINLHVPAGMYMVQIATADKQWVRKILVE
ncbi:MAG: Secretion system C-terminal sorting domain [Flavipsychrobacter sp.]|nr:Secretion system C-terminal sorting domain [Flavipsychrobacter sp.]